MPVYRLIITEDHRRLMAGIQVPKDRSLLGKTTETPEINDRLFRLYVLFFVFDTKPVQCFFQFFTVRAVIHGVDYYRAHFFTEI
jgi:hypothetical protein